MKREKKYPKFVYNCVTDDPDTWGTHPTKELALEDAKKLYDEHFRQLNNVLNTFAWIAAGGGIFAFVCIIIAILGALL